MNKQILFLLFMLPAFAFAQFTIADKQLTANGSVGSEVGAQTIFTNTSNIAQDTVFNWEVLEYTLPSQWSFGFCDPANCTIVGSGTKSTFNLDTGAQGLLKADPVFLDSVAGTGVVKVLIKSALQDSIYDTITFTVTATATFVRRSVKQAQQIKVFPNPAKDIVQVEMTNQQQITSIEVYNILGARVKTIQHQGGDYAKISINDLPKGMYILRIHDNGQTITKQFQKMN
jgi:hypothetical protein